MAGPPPGWRRWGAGHERTLRRLTLALLALSVVDALFALGPAPLDLLASSAVVVVGVPSLWLLLWTIRAGVRRPPAPAQPVHFLGRALVVLALAAFVVPDPWLGAVLGAAFFAFAAALLVGSIVRSQSPALRAFALIALASYAGALYPVLLGGGGSDGLRFAEATATLAPVPLFAHAYSVRRGRADPVELAVVPTATAALLGAVILLTPSATSDLVRAAMGVSLYLPLPLYVLGIWLAAAAVLLLLGAGRREGAMGVALVIIAGIDLGVAESVLVAAAGLLLWTLETVPPEAVPAVAVPVPAPAKVPAPEEVPAAGSLPTAGRAGVSALIGLVTESADPLVIIDAGSASRTPPKTVPGAGGSRAP